MLQMVANTDTELAIDEATFENFWLLYPRRVAKLAARKAWAKMSSAQKICAITAMADWRRVWADKDVEYLPHPASWLNGERWEDELPPMVSHASHVPATAAAAPERGAIPEHVRALLAKLRGK